VFYEENVSMELFKVPQQFKLFFMKTIFHMYIRTVDIYGTSIHSVGTVY
jgi:hypothetical protein